MTDPFRALIPLAVALAVLLPPHAAQGRQAEAEKPSLSLRATPIMGFTPLQVRVVAELRGGSDDFEEFYCPTIEWEWGDDTVSESSVGCDPYEAGTSKIQRRFTANHTYRQVGRHRIIFKLKQKTEQVAATNTSVQVRRGLGDPFGR